MAYIPDSGDIVWIMLNPQAGHEQAGHRPALVLSVFYKLKSAQFIIEKVPTLKVATLKLLFKRGPFYY